MNLEYEEKEENFIFRYWLNHTISTRDEDFNFYMDVNEWVGSQFGPIGDVWGYEKVRDALPNRGIGFKMANPVDVHYSWRFKHKADAMLFKLKWSGV